MSWLNDHINMISFIGAIVILCVTIIIALNLVKKMRTEKADGVLTDHEWDGIREFSNNIPTGWLLALLVLTLWAIWYILFGYPLNSYSQIGEYNEETRLHSEKFDKIHENMDANTLKDMGEQIFLVQCAQCHGLTAEGNDGKAQNLTHWGKIDGIMDTIKHGSQGLKDSEGNEYGGMPEGLLEEEKDILAVANYVMAEIVGDKSKKYDDELVSYGSEVFANNCAACHGEKGEGTEGVAPSLMEYGKVPFITNVLKYGKRGNIGFMPSFQYLNFGQKEIEALQAFIANKQKIQ